MYSRNKSWKPECVGSFNMDWRILVFYPFLLLKKPELFLRIISLAHAPMNVTDISIGSINCDPNNADRGRSIINLTKTILSHKKGII
jgi:hypothetical protein